MSSTAQLPLRPRRCNCSACAPAVRCSAPCQPVQPRILTCDKLLLRLVRARHVIKLQALGIHLYHLVAAANLEHAFGWAAWGEHGGMQWCGAARHPGTASRHGSAGHASPAAGPAEGRMRTNACRQGGMSKAMPPWRPSMSACAGRESKAGLRNGHNSSAAPAPGGRCPRRPLPLLAAHWPPAAGE